MDYKELTAPCGVPCFECNAYKASFNEQLKKGISQKLGMEYEKSACAGCRARKGIGFLSVKNNIFPEGKCALMHENGQCKIYVCAESKGIHNCSECKDFPCDKLQPLADRANLIPHNLKIYHLSMIKKLGLQTWAKEEAGKIMKDYMTRKLDSK